MPGSGKITRSELVMRTGRPATSISTAGLFVAAMTRRYRGSVLDGALQHAADEVSLEEQVEHHHRKGHEHRARGQQHGALRVLALEEGQPEREIGRAHV